MNKTFHFYPTLLNEYERFAKNPSEENKDKLFNRINRIPESDPAVLAKFKRGISFEDAVLKNKDSKFPPELIAKAQEQLPQSFKSQKFIEFVHDNIQFYGYADVVGESRVIDLKSTANHRPGRHDHNFQNLYLYALKDFGFKCMEYHICDGENLYLEKYDIDTYDFEYLLDQMKNFSIFIEENENMVKDKKIIQYRQPDLFG
ncbi:hypothetical protein SAMN06298216_1111 [Spirosomataceae bacterium TFI 002]|nr:hypothetical protein SAMN06298216_1111 [Spirosomataceae bacterium TFI 002]